MTDSATRERLIRRGRGETIATICTTDGLSRADFDRWWADECERRLPHLDGLAGLPTHAEIQILRDGRGVPHIFATNDHDLFVGYGFAMAQDRRWQDIDRHIARQLEILAQQP